MADDNITGRDDYIVARALYLAIKWIDAMPVEHKSPSDQTDMRAILDARWPELKETFAFQDDLALAKRNGFQMEEGQTVTHDDLREFLVSLPDHEGSA